MRSLCMKLTAVSGLFEHLLFLITCIDGIIAYHLKGRFGWRFMGSTQHNHRVLMANWSGSFEYLSLDVEIWFCALHSLGAWFPVFLLSYTLSREYRVVRDRYSGLLFTSEDRLCAKWRVQEQSTNMTSQCQYSTFAWRHRSTVVTSKC